MSRKRGSEIESAWIQLREGSQIHWQDTQVKGKGTQYRVTCGHCGQDRWVYRSAIISRMSRKEPFTGLCTNCSPHDPPKNPILKGPQSPYFRTGRTINGEGYASITLNSLSGRKFDIAEEMAKKGPTRRVAEHRLVMAVHLDRPLQKDEVVHHRNGVRDDNRLENLQLLTINTHCRGHGDYYQLAEELKVEIKRLRNLVISFGGNPD